MSEGILLSKLAEGEGDHQDFKFCIKDSRKLAESISAFSNASGGSVFIGVKDNGKVKGIDPEEEGFMVDAAASMHCKPAVDCSLKVWETPEGKVLEVIIGESAQKPVLARTENDRWRAFVRVNDINHLAPWILTESWKVLQSRNTTAYRHGPKGIRIFEALRNAEALSQKEIEKKTRIPRPVLIKLMGRLLAWKIILLSWGADGPLYSLNHENPLSTLEEDQSKVPFRKNKAMEK
jgi:hypothetical protein